MLIVNINMLVTFLGGLDSGLFDKIPKISWDHSLVDGKGIMQNL